MPFSIGHAFKQGELAPGDFLRGTIAGEADVPLQFNFKASHPDGSVRHALISGVLPALAAGANKTMTLVRASSGTSTAPGSKTAAAAAGMTVSATIVTGGVTYIADASAALAAGAGIGWRTGAILNEFVLAVPFKTAGGVAHSDLEARFEIAFYAGANKGRASICIEHTKAYSATGDISYDLTYTIAGATVYSKAGITHFPCGRFRRAFWWNNAAPLHIRHNTAYLIASKQVPNYDRRVVVTEPTLAGYKTTLDNPANFDPMQTGTIAHAMGGTGGQTWIGLLPDFAASAILSMDARAVNLAIASSEAGGAWNVHRRDDSTGPGAGLPLSVINWPGATIFGNPGDTYNANTGQFESFPSQPTVSDLQVDDAHQPALAILPYLLTGDYFHLEELQFWATWLAYAPNPGYRQHEKGLLTTGQLRAQGWSLRTMADAAAITPDSHYLKSHLKYWLDQTLLYHNTQFTDNPSANAMHLNPTDIPHRGGTAIPQWMDDHFTSSIGHTAELGFTEAARLLYWKAKYQVDRMLDPALCWVHAAMYDIKVRDTPDSPLYTTLAECYAKTAAAGIDPYLTASVAALPCGSPERLAELNAIRPLPSDPFGANEMTGYPSYVFGYPANYQPALAYAADSGYPNGDLAFMQFDSRANQPDYGTAPNFAIVPRGATTIMPATLPADNYAVASGQPMYIGRAAPAAPSGPTYTLNKNALTFDELTGDANPYATYFSDQLTNQINSTGKKQPLVMDLHGSSGAAATGRMYTAIVDGAMAFTEDNDFQFCFAIVYDGGTGIYSTQLRPLDVYTGAGATGESSHCGFVRSDGKFHLISEHRYDALLDWVDDPTNTAISKYDLRRRVLKGGSMGGWGTISFGVRRHSKFAALYADRPRWHFGNPAGQVNLTVWGAGKTDYTPGQTPLLAAEDGTGSAEDYTNMIAYVANTANKVRPILWCGGRNDPYYPFTDFIAAVDALRTAKRWFCVAWNDGDHVSGSIMGQIYASYPFGTFSRDQGYPLFTSHSLDQNPRIDLVGMINGNLSFRNVVETANGWSCEVTSIAAACTVDVEPISEVFIKAVAKQHVVIPAANTWVPVSFT